MRKMLMKKGFMLLLAVCFFAVCGVVHVSAEEEEEAPVIALGKDVTITYSNDYHGLGIIFYPENTGYQCYRVTGKVIDASSDKLFVTAYASSGGWSDGSGFGWDEDELSKAHPERSYWTTLYKKRDGDDLNVIIDQAEIPYDWQEGYEPNAFIKVKWSIEKLIGLQDPQSYVEVTLSQRTLYYDGTGEKPKPTVTSVTVNGKKLVEGRDYRVSNPWYLSDTEGGITIFGEGDYGDIIREYFTLTSKKEDAGKKDDSGQGGKVTPDPNKKAQPMTVKSSAKSVKYSKVKKKAATVKPIIVKSAQGTVSYKVTGGKKKAKKALTVNAKNGKVTVKKGTKKGTYKIKVTVTAAGNAQYNAGSKTVDVSVKVK